MERRIRRTDSSCVPIVNPKMTDSVESEGISMHATAMALAAYHKSCDWHGSDPCGCKREIRLWDYGQCYCGRPWTLRTDVGLALRINGAL